MKIIKIKLIDSVNDKFHVTLTLIDTKDTNFHSIDGFLPSLPFQLETSFKEWKEAYYELEDVRKVATRLSPKSVVNHSSAEQKEQVKITLNKWLDSGESSWQPIRDELIYVLSSLQSSGEEIRLFLDIENPNLRRIPWQEWSLFESRFPQTEIAIRVRGKARFKGVRKFSKVRIILIVGKSDGINTELDLEVIQKLKEKGAEVKCLNQPTREILSNALREEPGYHILVFAGHSCSKEDGSIGWIDLNEEDRLSIEEFKNSLKYAIDKGLQLAIFNSCDGLGLANQLANLGLSRIIVMREPVPDMVAVKFLEYFFTEFANNKSLFESLQIAKGRLEHFEKPYPGAMWLPTLCIQETALSHSLRWEQFIHPNIWEKFKLLLKLANMGCLQITVAGILLGLLVINVVKNQFISTPDISSPPEISQNISQGEKLLISSKTTLAKEMGIQEFDSEKFARAIAQFRQSLQINKNDPETLIYLNNAIAQQKSNSNIGEKIEIAVSVPIGQESDIAQEILRGVAQAQSEFNCGLNKISLAITNIESTLNCSGSFNGKFLQVTIADDEYLPKTAEKIAQALVENEKIIAVIGHSSSDMTLQAGDIYNEAKLVAISPTSTSISLKNFGKFVFRVAPSDDLAAQTLWNYLNQQNWAEQKIAVAYIPGNNYSESLAKEFEKLLPANFVHKCDISVGNFSASDCVESAKNQGAEIMFLIPATDRTLGNAIGIINNAKGLKLLGGDSAYNPRVLKDAGKQGEQANFTLAIPWHRYPNSEFAQTAKKFWNAEVSWRTATSYDATQTIIKAMDKMMGNYSRKQLQSILSSRDFYAEGVTGKIIFGKSGDRQFLDKDKSVLVQVKPSVKSGKYEFVILEQ
ncbi:MAG: ABC transporter substrate-binding protein [Trichodesmium sp. MO_231.B1]|nr:ABC transporter substrate-binding protein [Trichodesmium sp. MO_231.B1]